MNWRIPASLYKSWKDFSIEIEADIILQTGFIYHLKGGNGSGKTSFVKKILIPHLLMKPESQYILYIEQQVQSQLDAVKSYAALQKPAKLITSSEDMTAFCFENLIKKLEQEARAVMLILDECILPKAEQAGLTKLNEFDLCIIYIAHQDCAFNLDLNKSEFFFKQINQFKSVMVSP